MAATAFHMSVYSCKYNFFFFSQRVIQVWNSLPSNFIEATSLDAFKSRLSKIDLSNCIISSRKHISACTRHYLPQSTFCTCKSINQFCHASTCSKQNITFIHTVTCINYCFYLLTGKQFSIHRESYTQR